MTWMKNTKSIEATRYQRTGKDPVQQDDQRKDFTIQMRVMHCAVLSHFNGSWNYALASVSSYKTSDNFTTLASK